jgi:hypothetical protein
MSDTKVDVSVLVDAAFDELECVSRSAEVQHSGPHRAYYIKYCSCQLAGFMCEAHFNHYLAIHAHRHGVARQRCTHCNDVMEAGTMVQVFPL